MNPYKIYALLAAAFVLFIGVVLAINPPHADFLFEEDGIVEISGIAVAAVSMVLALVLAFLGFKRQGVWRFWMGISFLSFLFIGETLSWGERIFNLSMPRIAGIKFDALHDALSVSIGIIKRIRDYVLEIGIFNPGSIIVILTSAAGIFALAYFIIRLISKHKKDLKKFFRANLKKAPFFFMVLALVLIAIALYIDDDNLVQFPHKEVADEGFELLGVLALLFSSICGFVGKKWGFANSRGL